jgi:hypothetical protein
MNNKIGTENLVHKNYYNYKEISYGDRIITSDINELNCHYAKLQDISDKCWEYEIIFTNVGSLSKRGNLAFDTAVGINYTVQKYVEDEMYEIKEHIFYLLDKHRWGILERTI